MLIELADGVWVNPELVAVVKKTSDNECALFTAGQSAVDGGYALPFDAGEVAQQLNEAEAELYAQDDQEAA